MLRLSLRHLVLGTLLVVGVLLALGQFVFILHTHAREADAGLEAVIRHAGVTLAANIETALGKGDEGYVEHLLAQQVSLPNLVHAALVGGDDLIVGSTIPRVVSMAPRYADLAPPAALVRVARRTAGGQMSHEAEINRLWGVFPVRFPPVPEGDARAIGYVVLLVDTAPHQRAALRQALFQSAVLLLPLVLLAVAIGVMVKRVLTDRIEQLLRYIRSQVRGGAGPAPVSGGDELGQLGSALSALMKEVLDSRDYHVRFLERLPNPIWRAGADGQCTYFNAAWLAFTGRTQVQEEHGGWLEGVHPDDLAACRATQARAMERREPFAIEFRLRHRDGRYHWLSQHGSPLFGGEGEFLGYIGSCFDIQGVRDAAAETAASEARFRALVEHALVGVYLLQNGIFVYANPRLAEWFGRPLPDIVGRPALDLVHPADRATVRDRLRQREAGEVDHVHYSFRGLRADGSNFPVEVYGSRIEHEGRPAVIGTLLDLTERESAQAALKAATEVVEASPTALFRWRLEPGRPVSYVSENVHRWGYTNTVMLAPGFRFIDLVHPDDVERVLDVLARHLAAGDCDYVQDYRIRIASGGYIWIEELARIERAADGTPLFVEGLVTDISERKAVEDRVRQLNAELEARVAQRTAELAALNKELETFAYSVSHDLKAPLRGIDGYSHLLLEDHGSALDDEGRLFLRNIRAGVRQMATLIDDLLAYSRVERRSLQRLDVSVRPVLQGVLAERAADFEGGRAVLEVDVPDVAVKADPEGLAMILRNLVANALKYSRDSKPPQIRIRARADGEVFHLSVQDNGIGFDMKFHDRIFEIFQRLQRAEDYAGTGVGLAIVRKAVQRMGGRVWAESAPGAGATFHLEMPL